eukprot:scaffold17319_cov99-Phaeocystis_antarctica.AAC.1
MSIERENGRLCRRVVAAIENGASGFMRLRNITGKGRLRGERNAAETRYTTIPGVILSPCGPGVSPGSGLTETATGPGSTLSAWPAACRALAKPVRPRF